MFFSDAGQSNLLTVSRSQALREANKQLRDALDTYFRAHDTELRKQLEDAGITGSEQDEFLRDFYHRMQLKMINEFKENVKAIALGKAQNGNAAAGRKG